MDLPKVITELVKTQNSFDSVAYAQCFTDTAIVLDEGRRIWQKRNRTMDR
jgi:hypothetical protein